MKKIEKSITGTYSKTIWRRFIKAVEEYNLIQDGDVIAVCISGGKDSMLLAKLLQMTAEYKLYDIKIRFLMLDPGYEGAHLERIETNAKTLGIDIEIFKENIFDSTDEIGKNPCFFCSRMRRGYLYRIAKEMGCNKIALGHHYNDVVETILMGMLYGAQMQTMLPRLRSDNVEGMELIRPMYLIHEKDIIEWRNANGLEFVKCSCRLSSEDGHEQTTRLKVKKLIEELMKDNDAVEANIFGSVMNVDLNKIMSYKKDGERFSVLDD